MTLCVDEGKFKALPVHGNLRQDLPRMIASTLGGFIHKTPSLAEQDAEDSKVLSLLQQYAEPDTCWEDIINLRRNTVLHLAAIKHMPKTVKWTLQQPFGDRLAASSIKRAAIPCARDSPRTFAESGGHQPRALEVLTLFRGLPPASDRPLRLSYGVIAANASGIMSPRVVFALLFQAKINHDTLADDLKNDGKPLVEMNDYCLKHLPLSVRDNLKTNKSMRQGYTNMFLRIAECLKAKLAPTTENALSVS
jgi:hypothetical protein